MLFKAFIKMFKLLKFNLVKVNSYSIHEIINDNKKTNKKNLLRLFILK